MRVEIRATWQGHEVYRTERKIKPRDRSDFLHTHLVAINSFYPGAKIEVFEKRWLRKELRWTQR